MPSTDITGLVMGECMPDNDGDHEACIRLITFDNGDRYLCACTCHIPVAIIAR